MTVKSLKTSMKRSVVVVAAAMLPLQAATVHYFPSASDPNRQGFVRIINHSSTAGDVSVAATDDSGVSLEAVSLPIAANATVHFNSDDLEIGNTSKGLGGVGIGQGDWRLRVSSDLNVEVLAYIRTNDGFLTAMLDEVPRIGHRHRIATFNPASNVSQVSQLRLVNDNDVATAAQVIGIDGTGSRSELSLTVPAGRALWVGSQHLESGIAPASWPAEAELDGALGNGVGKWQLIVTAVAPLVVMNLMSTPDGQITSLSATPELLWRGLVVEPESRCAEGDYDRDEYGTRYRDKEDEIIEELGAIYSPYTGACFASERETEIDHIVALAEAHASGMCRADEETKRRFAGDIVNLTLAAPKVNREKGSLDAFDWMPDENGCWFADRVVRVKQKYAMTVDRDEAAALEGVLASCKSTAVLAASCPG